MSSSSIKTLRYVALAEATSFLALLVASYVKHDGGSEVGVQILGPVHGILFIAYVVIALLVARAMGWSVITAVLVLLGAVVPFGGFVVDRWLARSTQPSAVPAAARCPPICRASRWCWRRRAWPVPAAPSP